MLSNDVLLDKKIFKNFFGIEPSQISDKVIISPFLSINSFKKISPLSKEFKGYIFSGITSKEFTYIKTGMGSNMLGDCILSLKNSPVKTMVFIGSCGGFGGVRIGDIILPKRAYNGEGFSRYFNETAAISDFPPENFIPLNDASYKNAFTALKQSSVEFKTGDIYTIGSLFAEKNDFLKSLGANGFVGIDLELSAFFSSLKILDIKGAALLYAEDTPLSIPFWASFKKTPLSTVINSTAKLALDILNAL